MSKVIKLKKGLDIQIKGEPANILEHIGKPETFAIKPADIHGLIPKLSVTVGEKVKAGTPLFFDKYQPEIWFVSPVSGEVTAINRGERRRILEVVVKAERVNLSEEFLRADRQKKRIRFFLKRKGLKSHCLMDLILPGMWVYRFIQFHQSTKGEIYRTIQSQDVSPCAT